MGRIIFVTGTDTGVGKTFLTALLLQHLRAQKKRALAIKPFCSGGRDDAELLHSLVQEDITLDELNPFYFEKPLAPYLAANKRQRKALQLRSVIQHVERISQSCDFLLVEGAGGLFVPVGENWFVIDLIQALDCEVILVSPNRLGTINHTILSVHALGNRVRKSGLKIVLMGQEEPDFSSKTNGKYLTQALAETAILGIKFQSAGASSRKGIKAGERRLKKVLAQLVV